VEHIKAFFHKHPIESALLAGVAVIALYFALKPAPASSNNGEAQLQQDYFAAEGIQAQSNAAIQVAGITTSAQTAQTKIAADTSTANANIYATLDQNINASNNNTAIAALPYAEESQVINALSGVSSQTVTKSSSSSSGGFFGIGAGSNNSTTTTPTDAATHAGDYLASLANGLFAHNGGG
jgi:hypothetical protein